MINKEEKLLRRIFGEKGRALYKNKYEVDWCDSCNAIIIKCPCPSCHATSCNCVACDKCSDDIKEFHKHKNQPRNYLSGEEYKAVEKFFRLRDFIEECLYAGFEEINWKWIYTEEKACKHDRELFPELQKLHEELKIWPD